MRLKKLIVACWFVSSSAAAGEGENMSEFRLFACWVRPDYVALVFRSEAGNANSVEFVDEQKEIVIESSTTKGRLRWSDTNAVHVVPIEGGGGGRLLSIEFRINGKAKPHVFEAGIIDDSCLLELRARYGASVSFEEQ